MTLTGDTGVRFSELEQPELIEYRPLNRFAFSAFVVGWLSSLALLHPVFGVLPLTGLILSLVALRQFRSTEIKQSGRTLAVFGLGLSLLFGSWAVARESSRELHLYGQARQFAENWLALMREGKLYELHQLTVPEENRAAAGIVLAEHYAVVDRSQKEHSEGSPGDMSSGMMEMMNHPHFEFDSFFTQPVIQRLRDSGNKAQYEYREAVQLLNTGPTTSQMELLFDVRVESVAGQESFPIRITLARDYKPGLAAVWHVVRVTGN